MTRAQEPAELRPVHFSDGMSGWGACSLPCKRPGCRVHVPKVEQPRRIALPLAADTSDTRCGSCPSLEADWSTAANADRCTAFRKLVHFHGATAKDGYYERLPECRAAEVR